MAGDNERHFENVIAHAVADGSDSAGGIPYRLQAGYPTIVQNDEGTTATEQYLIKSSDANAFSLLSFPPPIVTNGIGFVPRRRWMPGTKLATKEVEFTPQSDELVWDPMGVYSNEDNSFDPYCLATITYGTEQGDDTDNDKNQQDPITFLERSITAGGQFMSLPPQKMLIQDGDVDGLGPTNVAGVARVNGANQLQVNGAAVTATELVDNAGGSSSAPNSSFVDDGYGSVLALSASGALSPSAGDGDDPAEDGQDVPGGIEENRDYELPVMIMIPTIEYSLRWPIVLNPQFGRFFHYLGRVNSDRNPLFWNAKRETVLFMGVNARQKFIWNGAQAVAQPWSIEFRFSQRVVSEGGRTYGWLHVYSPDKGMWVRAYRAGGLPLYSSFSLANFFK